MDAAVPEPHVMFVFKILHFALVEACGKDNLEVDSKLTIKSGHASCTR